MPMIPFSKTQMTFIISHLYDDYCFHHDVVHEVDKRKSRDTSSCSAEQRKKMKSSTLFASNESHLNKTLRIWREIYKNNKRN